LLDAPDFGYPPRNNGCIIDAASEDHINLTSLIDTLPLSLKLITEQLCHQPACIGEPSPALIERATLTLKPQGGTIECNLPSVTFGMVGSLTRLVIFMHSLSALFYSDNLRLRTCLFPSLTCSALNKERYGGFHSFHLVGADAFSVRFAYVARCSQHLWTQAQRLLLPLHGRARPLIQLGKIVARGILGTPALVPNKASVR
jgi:hypothetical protein